MAPVIASRLLPESHTGKTEKAGALRAHPALDLEILYPLTNEKSRAYLVAHPALNMEKQVITMKLSALYTRTGLCLDV
jgi:hypothetical protein